MDVLSEANERMDRRYDLRSQGYTIQKLEERVLEIYRIDREELYSKGRQKVRADSMIAVVSLGQWNSSSKEGKMTEKEYRAP